MSKTSPISIVRKIIIQGRYIAATFINRLYRCHVNVYKKVSQPSRSCHTGEFPDLNLTCVNLFDDPVKWYCNLLFICYPFRTQYNKTSIVATRCVRLTLKPLYGTSKSRTPPL